MKVKAPESHRGIGFLFSAFAAFAMIAGAAPIADKAKSCRLVFSGYEGKESLVDFPALVKIPDGLTGFDYADSAADGSDLAFFGADGRRLAHEIDTWDPDGASYVWVRVPELTKTTAITARWGLSCATACTSSPRSAWSDDYLAVWHFSKFTHGVTMDSRNGLAAELRGKDVRKFINAPAYVGKGYYAASRTTKTGTYLNVPDDERWTAFAKTGRLAVSFMVNSTMDPDSGTEKHHARILSNKADFGDALGFEVAVAGGERIWSCGQGRENFWYDADKHGGMDKYCFRDGWAHVTVTFDGPNGAERLRLGDLGLRRAVRPRRFPPPRCGVHRGRWPQG
ncbi:MAG: hypothetical protein J6T51_03585 [Kiritimatiellae bacterium]|nr:hypothetical protein [Kiritimatiellia bacterium]